MTERVTSIRPRDERYRIPGFTSYGRKSRAEMIAAYRRRYSAQRDEAERALRIPDDELVVETYRGVWAQHGVQEVAE